MTRYVNYCPKCGLGRGQPKICLGCSSGIAELTRQVAEKVLKAQPCTYVPGEWVRHRNGALGLVLEDLGQTVYVRAEPYSIIWIKKDLRMVAGPPEERE